MKFFSLILAVTLSLVFSSFANASNSIAQLKAKIIEIANKNTNNTNNRAQVRAELDELIVNLSALVKPIDEATWTQFSPGSWKQIWADEQNNGSPEIKQNYDRIYQYVSPEGRAANFGERVFPNGQVVTFALEAVGEVSGNKQKTTILKGFSKATGLSVGTHIETLALDILEEKNKIFKFIPLGEFPKGPINASSDLTIHFLDQDLKVGTAPNVFTGDSEMFVLTRTPVVK